jgi:hypothetical protein
MRFHVISIALALALVACGSGDAPTTDDAVATGETAAADETTAADTATDDGTAEAEPEGDAIEAASLNESGHIEIKQYSVAYIGSGTLGKGTLNWGGKSHVFRIGGLGVGGVGVSSVDAEGTVYNLKSLDDFTGTYGNARMGLTVADKGKGKLWLKNPQGVVLKLHTRMKGLALTGGVDGIVITWDGAVSEAAREVGDGTKKAAGNVVEGTEDAIDSLKDRF